MKADFVAEILQRCSARKIFFWNWSIQLKIAAHDARVIAFSQYHSEKIWAGMAQQSAGDMMTAFWGRRLLLFSRWKHSYHGSLNIPFNQLGKARSMENGNMLLWHHWQNNKFGRVCSSRMENPGQLLGTKGMYLPGQKQQHCKIDTCLINAKYFFTYW